MSADRRRDCWMCRGDGHFWRVPDGFNPFYAGAIQTASVSRKVHCYVCDGTGVALRPQPKDSAAESASTNVAAERGD